MTRPRPGRRRSCRRVPAPAGAAPHPIAHRPHPPQGGRPKIASPGWKPDRQAPGCALRRGSYPHQHVRPPPAQPHVREEELLRHRHQEHHSQQHPDGGGEVVVNRRDDRDDQPGDPGQQQHPPWARHPPRQARPPIAVRRRVRVVCGLVLIALASSRLAGAGSYGTAGGGPASSPTACAVAAFLPATGQQLSAGASFSQGLVACWSPAELPGEDQRSRPAGPAVDFRPSRRQRVRGSHRAGPS